MCVGISEVLFTSLIDWKLSSTPPRCVYGDGCQKRYTHLHTAAVLPFNSFLNRPLNNRIKINERKRDERVNNTRERRNTPPPSGASRLMFCFYSNLIIRFNWEFHCLIVVAQTQIKPTAYLKSGGIIVLFYFDIWKQPAKFFFFRKMDYRRVDLDVCNRYTINWAADNRKKNTFDYFVFICLLRLSIGTSVFWPYLDRHVAATPPHSFSQ